jgi:hypothetical protein
LQISAETNQSRLRKHGSRDSYLHHAFDLWAARHAHVCIPNIREVTSSSQVLTVRNHLLDLKSGISITYLLLIVGFSEDFRHLCHSKIVEGMLYQNDFSNSAV